MSDCCDVGTAPASQAESVCPISGTRGLRVDVLTVKALLTTEALGRLSAGSHRFCPDAACEVVYFNESGQCFTRTDVRVPVWQKEPAGRRVICYCFGENDADIRREVECLGRSDAVERVRQHIQAGRCACEVRNPRGVCCLGDLTIIVRNGAVTP